MFIGIDRELLSCVDHGAKKVLNVHVTGRRNIIKKLLPEVKVVIDKFKFYLSGVRY